MAGKHGSPKRRAKPYRPKPMCAGGGLQVIAKGLARADTARLVAMPLDGEELTEVGVKYWNALADLKTGAATLKSWEYVTTGLNMTLGMCESGLGEDHIVDLVPALEGAARAKATGDTTGRYTLDAQADQAITFALEIHDQQMKVATYKHLFAAERIIEQRIRQGHHYNTLSPSAL